MSAPLALFDLDGTLVDSRRLIHASMDDAFRLNGLGGCAYDHVRTIVGIELSAAIRLLLPDDAEDALVDGVFNTFRETFVRLREEDASLESLYPGARHILETLATDGWVLGVATGKPRRGLDHILTTHDLGGVFATLNTSCTGPGKPDPRMVNDALRETGLASDACVMIGDTSHDIAMAVNAKVRGAGVTWGFHTREEIEAAGAHDIHDDFACLQRGLDRFARGRKEVAA
ncbi:HAD-IA family hydrolase [Hyphobacterium marinum]|uniref:HAD-IA family hydrolase n=1 Tax=Hyphobacterium marinum TaxID=3116574 RepID=A0ABU7LZB8_9PROT|nr:HAD-IA family hydrolase [Hyphobacterium sp. Y6023]MEE2566907.1 HAD-IA family hydrolase [Hyphobacterium sp. Y6023]